MTPPTIYLQWHGTNTLTWSAERQNESDVEYVRGNHERNDEMSDEITVNVGALESLRNDRNELSRDYRKLAAKTDKLRNAIQEMLTDMDKDRYPDEALDAYERHAAKLRSIIASVEETE